MKNYVEFLYKNRMKYAFPSPYKWLNCCEGINYFTYYMFTSCQLLISKLIPHLWRINNQGDLAVVNLRRMPLNKLTSSLSYGVVFFSEKSVLIRLLNIYSCSIYIIDYTSNCRIRERIEIKSAIFKRIGTLTQVLSFVNNEWSSIARNWLPKILIRYNLNSAVQVILIYRTVLEWKPISK